MAARQIATPRLDDKVAIVTGSSAGIGAATAVAFARLGAHVVLTGRNVENLNKVAKLCSDSNPKSQIITVVAEMSNEEDVEKIFKETSAKFGRLDILVNNAGSPSHGGIMESSLADFDRIIGINLRAVFQLTKLCIPLLIESKGNVISVGSIAGMMVFPGSITYSLSKAGLDHLTRNLAMELGPKGVRVNSVNPGCIKTDIMGKIGVPREAWGNLFDGMANLHALQRVAEPEEVASVIAFLASDMGSFVTGAIMPVDGGALWYKKMDREWDNLTENKPENQANANK